MSADKRKEKIMSDFINSYDKYGHKTGSYNVNGDKTTILDNYGHVTGYIKKFASGYTEYDKYGKVVARYH